MFDYMNNCTVNQKWVHSDKEWVITNKWMPEIVKKNVPDLTNPLQYWSMLEIFCQESFKSTTLRKIIHTLLILHNKISNIKIHDKKTIRMNRWTKCELLFSSICFTCKKENGKRYQNKQCRYFYSSTMMLPSNI